MQSMIRRMESVKSFFSCFDNSVSIDEFNEAIKEFDTSIEIEEDVQVLYNRGVAYKQLFYYYCCCNITSLAVQRLSNSDK